MQSGRLKGGLRAALGKWWQMLTQQPSEPKDLTPSETEPPHDHVFALYCDGHRVPTESHDVRFQPDGVSVVVSFITTANALATGDGDPRLERVWGKKAVGSMWFVTQPHPNPPLKWPRGGVVIIEDVIIPDIEADGVQFRCRATTQVVDWTREGNLAEPGDELILPDSWLKERA